MIQIKRTTSAYKNNLVMRATTLYVLTPPVDPLTKAPPFATRLRFQLLPGQMG